MPVVFIQTNCINKARQVVVRLYQSQMAPIFFNIVNNNRFGFRIVLAVVFIHDKRIWQKYTKFLPARNSKYLSTFAAD
jgi:hypothetical protein